MNNKEFLKNIIFCDKLAKYVIPLCFISIYISLLKLTQIPVDELDDGYVYKVVDNTNIISNIEEAVDIDYLLSNNLISEYRSVDVFEVDSFKATPKYIDIDFNVEVYEYVESEELVASKSYLEDGSYIIEFKNESSINLEVTGYEIVSVTIYSDDEINDFDYAIIKQPVYEVEMNDKLITFDYDEFLFFKDNINNYTIVDYTYELIKTDKLNEVDNIVVNSKIKK